MSKDMKGWESLTLEHSKRQAWVKGQERTDVNASWLLLKD